MMSSTQAFTLAWPMRNWTCLSNRVSMGMGSIAATSSSSPRRSMTSAPKG